MYTIIGADGREYGPVSPESIQQWIRSRRVDGATRIRGDSATEWTTVAKLAEFAEALQQVPPPLMSSAPLPSPSMGVPAGGLDLGSSGLPPDVAERDYSLDLGGCIGRAWTLLTGPNMWLVIGGVAVWLVMQIGLSVMAQIPLIGLLFSLASLVVGGALTGGLYAFMLRCVRAQPAEVGNLFDGFRYCFGQLFLGQLVVGLLTFATIIPGAVMIAAGVIMLSKEIAIPAAIALCAIGGIVALVPLFYFSVSWAMTLPLIMDKRLDFWPAMQLSRKVIGKHWWMMFACFFVAGLLTALGALLCLVGIFFTAPLGTATLCNAYETLFGQRTATSSAPVTPPANPFVG